MRFDWNISFALIPIAAHQFPTNTSANFLFYLYTFLLPAITLTLFYFAFFWSISVFLFLILVGFSIVLHFIYINVLAMSSSTSFLPFGSYNSGLHCCCIVIVLFLYNIDDISQILYLSEVSNCVNLVACSEETRPFAVVICDPLLKLYT